LGHKFEIFTAGCELCKTAIKTIKETICEKCEVIEYSLQQPISKEAEEKSILYDIRVVPSIVVDEKQKITGIPRIEEIEKIIADI
jgi:protein-disulfide isomerase